MTTTIQERKLKIIERVASLNDEDLLELIENLLVDGMETGDDESAAESESALVRERVAAYHAEPDDEITWEELQANLQANHALRG